MINSALLGWFLAFIIHQEINIAYRIKKALRIKITKQVKLIDCYPCFTFWTALIVSLDIYPAILAYLIAVILDRRL